MTCLVFFFASFFTPRCRVLCNFCMGFMFFLRLVLFSTSSLFVLYVCYECSLVPIVVIILKWGSYPDRSFRCFLLLAFTSFFTLPFIYFLVSFYLEGGSFHLYCNSSNIGLFGRILFLFSFGVKLPIYGLHFWLPIAHVEAPTFGSIVLAGVLLKLGGVGLIRVLPFISVQSVVTVFLSYFVLFTIYSTLVCCWQSDFKRLVAYSSVAHMMFIPMLILADEVLSLKMSFVVMFMHGISSPLLFMLVSVSYSIFRTRQLVLMRGILTFSPLLSFLFVSSFFIRISAPPFPGFVAELFSFISLFNLSWFLVSVYILVPFFSLLYNVIWLSSSLFSSCSPVLVISGAFLSFKSFYPIFISIFVFVPVLSFFLAF